MLDLNRFVFMPARQFVRCAHRLPSVPAVYLVLLRDGIRLLQVSGYFLHHPQVPLTQGDYCHVYTGASRRWVTRVMDHLGGTTNLGETLLSMERILGSIRQSGIGTWPRNGESTCLSNWLLENAMIGVSPNPDPFAYETRILREEPSPLNLVERMSSTYAQQLMVVRQGSSALLSSQNELPFNSRKPFAGRLENSGSRRDAVFAPGSFVGR
jgi:hypothetical protein